MSLKALRPFSHPLVCLQHQSGSSFWSKDWVLQDDLFEWFESFSPHLVNEGGSQRKRHDLSFSFSIPIFLSFVMISQRYSCHRLSLKVPFITTFHVSKKEKLFLSVVGMEKSARKFNLKGSESVSNAFANVLFKSRLSTSRPLLFSVILIFVKERIRD